MNSNLANSLLTSLMDWDATTLETERSTLEFMGSMMYDSYDRFMPGTRYMSSLVQWLNQFRPEHRKIVYEFIRDELVFISSSQMNYLVDLLYNSKIKPVLQNRAATASGKPLFMQSNREVRMAFDIEKRSALIVGLSDGAHTDILRRSAGFSNEQVLTNYYPGKDKLKEMLEELKNEKLLKGFDSPHFRTVFLIDDFTASGKSFIRFDESDNKFHGKLKKIITELCTEEDDNLSILFQNNQQPIDVHILFCIATDKARIEIESKLSSFLQQNNWTGKICFTVNLVQLIDQRVSDKILGNDDLLKTISKPEYYSNEIISKSFSVGGIERPYLGFDECALPVVLSHNTPNNSLPILWQYTEHFKGLFPRANRH